MFGLHIGRDKVRRVAIVDIGSSSAAVGVMELDSKGKSTLLAAQRSFIPYEKRTKEQFAARMGAAVEEAATKVLETMSHKDKKAKPLHEVFVFFRAPWIDAQVIRLTKNFGAETRITRDHIEELAKQALSSQQKLLEAMVL